MKKINVTFTATFSIDVEGIDNVTMETLESSIVGDVITPLNKKLWSGILNSIKCTGLEMSDNEC